MLETILIFAFTSEIICDNTLEGNPIGYYKILENLMTSYNQINIGFLI